MTTLGWSWLKLEWNWPSALGPTCGPNRMRVSTVGSLKFTCVTLAIRKTFRESKLCLTYYNLSPAEKPCRQRFIKSTKSAVKMCHSTVPAGLWITAQRHEDTTSQTLSSHQWLWLGTEVAWACTGSERQGLLLAPQWLYLNQGASVC